MRWRPRGRRVDSRYSRLALLGIQSSPPNGRPRCAERRTEASSPAVSGSFTRATQFGKCGSGHGERRVIPAYTSAGTMSRRTELVPFDPQPTTLAPFKSADSRKKSRNDFAAVGQPEIAALEAIGPLEMVEAESARFRHVQPDLRRCRLTIGGRGYGSRNGE